MASKRRSGGWLNPFLGWGISTLLLWLLNRKSNDSDNDSEPSPYSDDNTSSIGKPIPVALGRVMIKDPLVSYYGSFRADIYTEEYGAHSALDIWPWMLLLSALTALVAQKDTIILTEGNGQEVPTGEAAEAAASVIGAAGATISTTGGTSAEGMPDDGGKYKEPGKKKTPPSKTHLEAHVTGTNVSPIAPVSGTIDYSGPAKKRAAMMNALMSFLLWLISTLFLGHLARTTIQKGFLYYQQWV